MTDHSGCCHAIPNGPCGCCVDDPCGTKEVQDGCDAGWRIASDEERQRWNRETGGWTPVEPPGNLEDAA